MLNVLPAETEFALRAVRLAAQIAAEVRAVTNLAALTKSDQSPVTVADFAVQALTGHMLRKAFPKDSLVAEETSILLGHPHAESSLDEVTRFVRPHVPEATADRVLQWIDHGDCAPSGRFWTLDPIDGTKGFLRGDQYATALALIIDGRVELGVLACPRLLVQPGRVTTVPALGGSFVVAVRGHGAWSGPLACISLERSAADGVSLARLTASSTDDPRAAVLVRSFEDSHTDVERMNMFLGVLGATAKPLRVDSQAKYALVAAGAADLLVRLTSRRAEPSKIWDHAAGALLVEEAGGMVTDLDGASLDFTTGRTLTRNRGVLASNALLHPSSLEGLRRLGPPGQAGPPEVPVNESQA
jgi:3'(2'), 5'-bisphosphate nucleotidase